MRCFKVCRSHGVRSRASEFFKSFNLVIAKIQTFQVKVVLDEQDAEKFHGVQQLHDGMTLNSQVFISKTRNVSSKIRTAESKKSSSVNFLSSRGMCKRLIKNNNTVVLKKILKKDTSKKIRNAFFIFFKKCCFRSVLFEKSTHRKLFRKMKISEKSANLSGRRPFICLNKLLQFYFNHRKLI